MGLCLLKWEYLQSLANDLFLGRQEPLFLGANDLFLSHWPIGRADVGPVN